MNTTATITEITVTAINRGMGSIEIHKAGCRDLKRDARGASIWDITARDQKDVVEDVCGDFIDEDPDTTWEDFTGEITYANCCPELPYEISDPEVDAPKKVRVNQEVLIMAFLETHRGMNYTPHTLGKAIGHQGLRDAMRRLADAGKIDRVGERPTVYVLR